MVLLSAKIQCSYICICVIQYILKQQTPRKRQCTDAISTVNEIKVMLLHTALIGWLPDNQFIISVMIRILSIWINRQHLTATLLSSWDILAAPLGNLRQWQNMTKRVPAHLKHISCNEKSLSKMLSELAWVLQHCQTPIIRSVSKCAYWWTLTSVSWSMTEARSSWRQNTKHSFQLSSTETKIASVLSTNRFLSITTKWTAC